MYNYLINERLTMEETCDFCDKEWIGYLRINNTFPWVCEDHWKLYALDCDVRG